MSRQAQFSVDLGELVVVVDCNEHDGALCLLDRREPATLEQFRLPVSPRDSGLRELADRLTALCDYLEIK